MNKTKIEWVKNPDGTQGYTWNPITGCLNGCEYCYARKLANTRLFSTYCYNTNLAPNAKGSFEKGKDWVGNLTGDYTDPFYPRFWEDRLFQPFNDTHISQKGIFVCDMSDLFGIGITIEWTKAVIDVIEDCPTDRFYLLTKQPQNLIKWSPFPDNCWVGATATNQAMICEALKYLKKIQAKIKYISLEPLLGNINPRPIWLDVYLKDAGVSWLIIGQQTPVKMSTMPEVGWVEEIVGAADRANIAVFLKDNLISCIDQYPVALKDGKYRQEFPGVG